MARRWCVARAALWAAPLLAAAQQLQQQNNAYQNGASYDALRYVDTLIGTANGGDVFGGATRPYGMAKCVCDTNSQGAQGGFTFDDAKILGCSCLHDSGTGGQVSLSNFPLVPFNGCPDDDVNNCPYPKQRRAVAFKNDSVKAEPGYFGLELANGIAIETTVTDHVGLWHFTFPSRGQGSPVIFLDLADGANTRQDNGSVSVDGTTGRMHGGARFKPSFGVGDYYAYFCADFQGASIKDNGIVVDSRASSRVKDLVINQGINGAPLLGGAYNRFDGSTVAVRMGLSFISSAQACRNAEAEIPTFDFNGTRAAAKAAWAAKLKPITVSSNQVSPDLLKNFWSGVYRTMTQPQNYTGENPLWTSNEPYWDSFYCIWDTFRSQFPFLILVDPIAVASQIRGLIDIYRHEGWLPDCRMSFCKGFTQGGSNADVVLTDAYLKGVTGGINWDDGYAAIVKDATVEPFLWSVEGRGHLDSWNALHYVPVSDFDYKGFGTMTRSVSLNLEYAYNDFCISEFARKAGRQQDMERFQASSRNWQNLFKQDQISNKLNSTQSTGFVGFFQPKHQNGTWGFQDPLKCSNGDTSGAACSLTNNGAETFESSIWEYGFYAPHQMCTLVTLYGGPDSFVRRLDYMHDQNITYIGNEPAFLTVYQYHWAGRPGLSAKRAHFYIPQSFGITPGGLPGNDDSGAMGSFVAFSMMGLFPVPGQDVYLLTSPFFESVSIRSPVSGKTATVRVTNFDPTYDSIYVQNATLNGQPYTKNWIDHSFFLEGKELVLTVGPRESTSWGTKAGDLPPCLPDPQ